MPDYRHILFIKPSSLGDIVHAMPTCAAIRRAYPKARLTWLVKREWAGLVERIEEGHRVSNVDNDGEIEFASRLPDGGQARVVDIHQLAGMIFYVQAEALPDLQALGAVFGDMHPVLSRQIARPAKMIEYFMFPLSSRLKLLWKPLRHNADQIQSLCRRLRVAFRSFFGESTVKSGNYVSFYEHHCLLYSQMTMLISDALRIIWGEMRNVGSACGNRTVFDNDVRTPPGEFK